MPKPASDDLPDTQVSPDVSLEKRSRRSFSAAEKRAFIAKADVCKHGEIGAFLRKHGLYSQQVNTWRKLFAEGGEDALSKSAPGPTPRLTAEQREIEKLRKQNARLERESLRLVKDALNSKKILSPDGAGEQRERIVTAVLEDKPSVVPLTVACRASNVQCGGIYARRAQHARGISVPNRGRRDCSQPRGLTPAE